jgi:hypothetical protein
MPQSVASQLQEYQKRRLIQQLISLWKVKSIKKGINTHFNAIGSIESSYDEQFDFRWLLEDKAVGEDNFALTPIDLCTTDLYLKVPYWQEISLITNRSRANLGPLRVIFKNLNMSPVNAPAQLIAEFLLDGPGAKMGLDLLIDGSWATASSMVYDQFGYPLGSVINSPGANLGKWVRRSFTIPSNVNLSALALYDNNDDIGQYRIRIRRVVLVTDSSVYPLFCYKDTWTNQVVCSPSAGIYYQLSSSLSYYESIPLISSIASHMRPTGEKFKLHLVYERHIAPFAPSDNLYMSDLIDIDPNTGYIAFPGKGTAWVESCDTDKYLGAKDYMISIQVENMNTVRMYLNASGPPGTPASYSLVLSNGVATIARGSTTLATGTYDSRGIIHRISFAREGTVLQAYVDGNNILQVSDGPMANTMSGVWKLSGNGFQLVELAVLPIPTYTEELGT